MRLWTLLALVSTCALVFSGCDSDAEDMDVDDLGAQDASPQDSRDAGLQEDASPHKDAGPQDAGSKDVAAPPMGGVGCMDTIAPTAEAAASVLQKSCGLAASCHAGNAPQAGLNLTSLDAALATVGKPSMQAPAMMLIKAGDPENSYLLRKVRGMQTEGTKMPPPPSPALCDARLQALEAWIRAGASR